MEDSTPIEISRFIADNIKRRLKSLGIKNKELAVMMDVQASAVSRWLSGDHNFTIATLQQIQDALKINFFAYSEGAYNSCFPCVVDGLFIETK